MSFHGLSEYINLEKNIPKPQRLFWPTITKYHKTGGLNSRPLFPPYSGGCKSEIRLPAWLCYSKSSLVRTLFLVCRLCFLALSLPGGIQGRASQCFFLKGHRSHQEGPNLMTSSNLNYSLKSRLQIPSHGRLGLQYMILMKIYQHSVYYISLYLFIFFFSSVDDEMTGSDPLSPGKTIGNSYSREHHGLLTHSRKNSDK